MDNLPIFLNIKNRPCLVVGGGDVAARKIKLLKRAGGAVTVVSPSINNTLEAMVSNGDIKHHANAFSEKELQDCILVIAATDDANINKQVHDAAVTNNIPVNVVDHPDLCTFIMPSIVDRSPVIIAVSTGGASPVLARLLRARLETLIPASYGRLAGLLAGFRDKVKQRFTKMEDRRGFWENILEGPVSEMVFSGQEQKAIHTIEKALETDEQPSQGEVYLVGAGPGDPDLLTFRALRLMQRADVVLYDRLVTQEVLDLVRREAEKIYVGKKRDYHTVRQEEINQTLADLAKEGKRVLRLKGGDPFIFGRGGEEIATLAEQGVPFQVVPGVTAANGCACYAGIPLTHRDYAQSVIFVTGQLKNGEVKLNWQSLAQPQQTIVIYMGLQGLDIICEQLIKHGLSDEMPAALVQQGTTPQQRVIKGTLSSLPVIVNESDVHAPTLLIIGEVVELQEQLQWFESDL